jgi:hypothetical protein
MVTNQYKHMEDRKLAMKPLMKYDLDELVMLFA